MQAFNVLETRPQRIIMFADAKETDPVKMILLATAIVISLFCAPLTGTENAPHICSIIML